MKIDKYKFMIFFFLFYLLLSFTSFATAEYNISINASYCLVDETIVGSNVWNLYDITVTINNNGDSPTDNLSIILADNVANYSRFIKIPANSQGTVQYKNHPLEADVSHNLKIHYYPTNPNIKKTIQNSGVYELTINDQNNDNNNTTPGFEIALLLMASMIMIIIMKHKRD